MDDTDALAVVGTYSDADENGVFSYRVDRETGALESLDATPGGADPSFLAVHPDGERLYAVNETDPGTVRTLAIDPSSGELTELNSVDSGGDGPCYCSVVSGHLVVAHYAGGVVSLLPIGDDGRIEAPVDVVEHEGSSVDPERQTQPHPHSAVGGPSGRYVYVPDLGTDRVVSYRLDDESGELDRTGAVDLPDGAGPRHFEIGPDGDVAYVINELDSTIATLDLDDETGELSLRETVSTLPEGVAGDDNITADVHLHPSGLRLYGSNRGHDSIAIFDVDEDGGLAAKGHESTRGEWPRHFAIDPTGEWLFAENMRSDAVVTFGVEPDGTLAHADRETTVPQPVCMRFC